jgi:hypothetical protein
VAVDVRWISIPGRGGPMQDDFHLLDLPSQASAIQRMLLDRTEDEKLAWLDRRGRLSPLETPAGARRAYLFVSTLGLECVFFISGNEFVFFGDHTTYTVKG